MADGLAAALSGKRVQQRCQNVGAFSPEEPAAPLSASVAGGSDRSAGAIPVSVASPIDVGADSDSGAGRFHGLRHCSRRVRTGAAGATTAATAIAVLTSARSTTASPG